MSYRRHSASNAPSERSEQVRCKIAALFRFVAWIGCLAIVSASCAAQHYGTITGTVLDQNGSPISKAKVTARYVCLTSCGMSGKIPQIEADEQGRYRFPRLEYGRYFVSAEKAEDDYPPLYIPFYFTQKQPEIELSETNRIGTLDLILSIKAGVLVGTVADAENGIPLDASVNFRSTTDPRRCLSGSGLTNAQFRVLVPSDMPFVMKVSRQGYDDWFFTRNGVVTPLQLGPGETMHLEIQLRKSPSEAPEPR